MTDPRPEPGPSDDASHDGPTTSGAPEQQRSVPPVPLPPGAPIPSYAPRRYEAPAERSQQGPGEPDGRSAGAGSPLDAFAPPGSSGSPRAVGPASAPTYRDPSDAQHQTSRLDLGARQDHGAPRDNRAQPDRGAEHTHGAQQDPLALVSGVPALHDPWGAAAHEEPRRRRSGRAGFVVAVLLAALVVGALGGIAGPRLVDALDGRPSDGSLPTVVADPDLARPDGSIADIAATVGPSVVSIRVSGADGQGTGSGFVIREDGYILTNNHVIAGAVPSGTIRVTFADGSEEDATLVGRTADYDLAVIQVDLTGLTPLGLGDSDAVTVGDPVIAIGAPLGLDGTVTSGIISALNRPVSAGDTGDTAFINALQTDAAINPGNSGGPLVDASGNVIGINSAIAQPPGQLMASGNIGLGFAIGSNQAKRTAEEIIETGSASYPIIGVLLDPSYDGEGVQVVTDPQDGQEPVTPDGPAADAGLEAGDVILAIDGRPVTQSDELIVAIRAKAPGDTVVLRVRSGGSETDVSIVLDKATSE